jgi:hypothetical protein
MSSVFTGCLVIARNYDVDQSPQVLRAFEHTIFENDRRVVEPQRPERIPFDRPPPEIHLKFDAVAMTCRRAMRDAGLAARPLGAVTESRKCDRLAG